MSEQRVELPKYTFSKGSKLTDEEMTRLKSTFNSYKSEKPVETQHIPFELGLKARQLSRSQLHWCRDILQVDVTKRYPDISKMFFFSKTNFEMYSALLGRKMPLAAHIAPYNEFHFVEKERPQELLKSIAHEFIHALSTVKLRTSVFKKDNGDRVVVVGKPYTYGYENTKNGTFFALNEAVTEMLNIEILDDMRKSGKPDYLSGNTIGYGHLVIFLDALIEMTADISGKSHRELRHSLYRGYLQGDHSSLRIFSDTFGTKSVSYLAALDKQHSSWWHVKKVAEIFGLDVDQLEKKVELYVEQKKSVEIMGNVEINSSAAVIV